MGKQQIDNFPTADEWVTRQLETLLPSIDQDTRTPGHPDVMAAEVVGSVVERELLDALFTQRASLGDPMSVLGTADAAIVLLKGKPTGVVSRRDLLAFLAKGGAKQ